jgi:hypothetical protein
MHEKDSFATIVLIQKAALKWATWMDIESISLFSKFDRNNALHSIQRNDLIEREFCS